MILRKLILFTFASFILTSATSPIISDRAEYRVIKVQGNALEELKLKCFELKAVEEKIIILEGETAKIAERVNNPDELQKIKRKLKRSR